MCIRDRARALITSPQLILADEPTGALDSNAADGLLRLFGEINEEGQTILMVTHSTKAASHAKRVLFIKDGEVFHQIYKANMSDEEMFAKISDTLTVLQTGGGLSLIHIFSLPSEFFAQRNNRVKIGASNAQSQNKLSSIMRTMSRILTGLFLTCSAVSRIRKHKTSVVIMLNP